MSFNLAKQSIGFALLAVLATSSAVASEDDSNSELIKQCTQLAELETPQLFLATQQGTVDSQTINIINQCQSQPVCQQIESLGVNECKRRIALNGFLLKESYQTGYPAYPPFSQQEMGITPPLSVASAAATTEQLITPNTQDDNPQPEPEQDNWFN